MNSTASAPADCCVYGLSHLLSISLWDLCLCLSACTTTDYPTFYEYNTESYWIPSHLSSQCLLFGELSQVTVNSNFLEKTYQSVSTLRRLYFFLHAWFDLVFIPRGHTANSEMLMINVSAGEFYVRSAFLYVIYSKMSVETI